MASIISTYAISPSREIRIDEVNANLTYLGIARVDAATSSSIWQIRKIEKVGAETSIQWADGNDKFDNVWDNHASLSYS